MAGNGCQAQETHESGEDVDDHLRGEGPRDDWELSQRPRRRGELDQLGVGTFLPETSLCPHVTDTYNGGETPECEY